jgi:hypothetical protein
MTKKFHLRRPSCPMNTPRRKDEPMAFEFFSLPMIPWAECHGARRISVGPSEDGGKWYVMIDRGSSESERVEPGEVAIVADVGPFSTEAEAWGWVKALFMEHVQ